MKEIELKILDINKEAVLQKLRRLGAKANPRLLVVEEAWDFKNEKISKAGSWLRLRTIGNKTEFALKAYLKKESKASKLKVIEESETVVENAKAVQKILKGIGLKRIKLREKYRTHLVIGDTSFEIDEYPQIPPYLEIEGSQENIFKYVKLLGFTEGQTRAWGATKVLKYYKVNPYNLVFSK